MPLSHIFRETLRKLGGDWDCRVTASRVWVLTFFSQGTPPIAVAFLRGGKGRAFYEELVKLSDIKMVLDARAILVARPNSINADGVQLATNAGVYAVLESDKKNLEAALRGEEVSLVNSETQARLLAKRSISASQECRALEVDLLSKKWMTLRELEGQLQWRFDARTVRTQARSLQREGRICVCGRTDSGEGLLGTPGGHYKMRPDLSAPTEKALLSKEIIRLIEAEGKPLGYKEISERVGVRAHVATAALRGLAKEGIVEKKGNGWVMKAGSRG